MKNMPQAAKQSQTTQVRLLVPRATIRQVQSPGRILDVGLDEADRMIDAGQAERLGPETAATGPPNTAMKRTADPRI